MYEFNAFRYFVLLFHFSVSVTAFQTNIYLFQSSVSVPFNVSCGRLQNMPYFYRVPVNGFLLLILYYSELL